MEKYQQLSIVGEGSYGLVMKCKHRETNQFVAIKKFLETEEDGNVRKMALREIRMLKRLKHENLVTMIEAFRHKKRFYLVFEYLEGTILDELEKVSHGLSEESCRERIFQVTRAIHFCHMNNVIHRDIKPENVLVSSLGVVKLCDFGFARLVSIAGERCTEYVATRWYRAPELLVGDSNYGASVDIWAIGCLYAELMSGEPLFPGNSDIDQLHLTVKLLGKPCPRHERILNKNSQMSGIVRLAAEQNGLPHLFSHWPKVSIDFLESCLQMDPQDRPTSEELLNHPLFTRDNFVQNYLPRLRENVIAEFNENPLLKKLKSQILSSTDRASRREDMMKPRRSSQVEPQKWKFNLEGSVKRKFSYDGLYYTESTHSNDKNSTFYNHSIIGDNTEVANSLETMLKDKINQEFASSISSNKINSEIKLDEKISTNDSKYIQLNQKTTSKDISPIPATPPQFQSLQTPLSELSVDKPPSRISLQYSHSVLHPSVNNICFCKESPKKDNCDIFQTVHNASLKQTFNQMPLITPPRGQQYLKKLDRSIHIDTSTNCEPSRNNALGISWLNNLGNVKVKKKEKPVYEDFSLPVVPGATSSPNRSLKKSQENNNALITQSITPERRKVKRKHGILDSVKPYNTDKG